MIWTAKWWISLLTVVMIGGLLHTMIMTSEMTHGNLFVISHFTTTKISSFKSKKVVDVYNVPLAKKNAIHVKYERARAITTTTHVYSVRTKLLADLISQRYTHSNYKEDLLIASCINKDTKGLVWPDPLAVAAIIEIESQYQQTAISSVGAKGLMQISPVWGNRIPRSAYNTIKGNIKYGIYILRYYYKMYDGNRMAAILSYNSGNGAYNSGHAWPVYWYRFMNAKSAFDRLYSLNS